MPAPSDAGIDAVAFFVDRRAGARADIRERLKAAPDLARSLARLVVGRGGPRDLAAMRDGITAAADAGGRAGTVSEALAAELAQADAVAAPTRSCDRGASSPRRWPTNCRYLKRDGGFVRAGYDAALDEARALRDESRRVIAALQARYADDDRRHVR